MAFLPSATLLAKVLTRARAARAVRDGFVLRLLSSVFELNLLIEPKPSSYVDSNTEVRASGHRFLQGLLTALLAFSARPKSVPTRYGHVGRWGYGKLTYTSQIEVFDAPYQNKLLTDILIRKRDLIDRIQAIFDCCRSLSRLHGADNFVLGHHINRIGRESHIKESNILNRTLESVGAIVLPIAIEQLPINFGGRRVFETCTLLELDYRNVCLKSFSHLGNEDTFRVAVAGSEPIQNDSLRTKHGHGNLEFWPVSAL